MLNIIFTAIVTALVLATLALLIGWALDQYFEQSKAKDVANVCPTCGGMRSKPSTLHVEYDRDGLPVYAWYEDETEKFIKSIPNKASLTKALRLYSCKIIDQRWDGETSGRLQGYDDCTTGGAYCVYKKEDK